ncbi:unnamed protein product [Microthlaspi erraticum]|uniref:Uncharacterized protein n=1 Tax=Microthlaspi erraticum TaxID=1685480 RepID=A0A6D2KRQ8_9BRAS|nr:unnamed protein product [Microthlaspi erraticum]
MRGFNKPRKHEALKKWILASKPLFGCLLETRVTQEEHSGILSSSLPGRKAITNYDYHRLGRIWVCWTEGVEITLLFKSAQDITCAVKVSQSTTSFLFSAVYATNFVSDRTVLWDEIRATQAAYSHLSIPWEITTKSCPQVNTLVLWTIG